MGALKVKNMYNVSLCQNGILGGILYVKEKEVIYCTNKITVPKKIRRLHLLFSEIQTINKDRFHTVLIKMKNGEQYRFLFFSRNHFLESVDGKY